jgi:glycosyltransferase involved in cell wall biosynthesis
MARAGYRVTLIAARGDAPQFEGIEIRRVHGNDGRLRRATLTAMRVCREAIRVGADIYHFHDPELVPAGLLLSAMGKKVVFDVHEDIPEDILVKDYLPSWVRPILSRIADVALRTVCRSFSGVVAATPAIAERFSQSAINMSVVQNFPLADELAPPKRTPWLERAAAVAYVGGVTPIRGAREMVLAMAMIPRAVNARLKIAGEFLPAELHHDLSTLSGWSRVDYLGTLKRSSVAELLGNVRAGLVLFRREPCHVSAYPTKMFEYMSAGIPVIASNFPLWRTIIDGARCGLTVDPSDPQAIASAISYLLTHPEEAEAMGRCGQDAIRMRYNWGQEEQQLLAFYSRLE